MLRQQSMKPHPRNFGADNVRLDQDKKGGGTPEFPVLSKDGRIVSSLTQSQVLGNLPELQLTTSLLSQATK